MMCSFTIAKTSNAARNGNALAHYGLLQGNCVRFAFDRIVRNPVNVAALPSHSPLGGLDKGQEIIDFRRLIDLCVHPRNGLIKGQTDAKDESIGLFQSSQGFI